MLEAFMASEKVTRTVALTATPVLLSDGLMELTLGGVVSPLGLAPPPPPQAVTAIPKSNTKER